MSKSFYRHFLANFSKLDAWCCTGLLRPQQLHFNFSYWSMTQSFTKIYAALIILLLYVSGACLVWWIVPENTLNRFYIKATDTICHAVGLQYLISLSRYQMLPWQISTFFNLMSKSSNCLGLFVPSLFFPKLKFILYATLLIISINY